MVLLKHIVVLTLAILFTAAVGSYCSSVWAQVTSNTTITNTNTTITNTNLTETINTKFIGVAVLFESPHTFILRGEPTDPQFGSGSLWQAVDLVKTAGYKIDSVAQVTEESSAIGNTRYLTPVYTIFFSK